VEADRDVQSFKDQVVRSGLALRRAQAAAAKANASSTLKFLNAEGRIRALERVQPGAISTRRPEDAWGELVSIESSLNDWRLSVEAELQQLRMAVDELPKRGDFSPAIVDALQDRTHMLAEEVVELRVLHEALLELMRQIADLWVEQ
jgi:hypothetical protein